MSLIEELDDETKRTLGEEIALGLADVVAEIGQQNEALAQKLTESIVKAIGAVESKEIVINKQEVKKWTFKVVRDKSGLMTDITATAT